jgi:hypothetical protein
MWPQPARAAQCPPRQPRWMRRPGWPRWKHEYATWRPRASRLFSASSAPVGDRRAFEDLEGRLGRLVAESERRQRAEMAVQIAQMWKDLSAVRASDFVRVQESLDRVQGQTALQLRQHRDQVQSQLYRVSIQR